MAAAGSKREDGSERGSQQRKAAARRERVGGERGWLRTARTPDDTSRLLREEGRRPWNLGMSACCSH
eukprot:3374709-Rhodomonas_salina.1